MDNNTEKESYSNSIVPNNKHWQPILPGSLSRAGEAANRAASRHRFEDYKQRRADHTLRRQRADLLLFTKFLSSMGVPVNNLFTEPNAWIGITWGLVEAFIKWQLGEGYAVTSVNVRLSTIKAYARLAFQAGAIPAQEYALIRSVVSYTHKEQLRIDQKRKITRIGLKKETPTQLSPEQASKLKRHPNTPQGRRDSLLMCLLLDHGLRVGELSSLCVDMVNIKDGLLRFFRPKVGKIQIHRLSKDTQIALQSYYNFNDIPENGSLLRRSKKSGKLGGQGISERGITQRVNTLGEEIGVIGLSPHDCRHYWATSAARHGTDPFVLQEAGGWASLAMPRRYIEANDISNSGVKLE